MADAVGIDKIGVARADALIDERRHLEEWLSHGFNGTMAWMEREPEKRADPRILFPGCRSVLVAAINYYTAGEHGEDPSSGKISRYAWGDDYHDVVREKLELLTVKIRDLFPDVSTKICIDTVPFMDKAWAHRAGLGWLGKHSNLITKELGSWVFIGSILLDKDVTGAGEPVADHCGTCRLCIDACPTGAIVAEGIVDSRRCISYATIELRDETLPADISEHQDGWLYGCDVCQDVCPWNRFETPADEPRFEPRAGETSLDLENIADMEHEEYVVRFRRSAIKRAKLAGLKRNAAALRRR